MNENKGKKLVSEENKNINSTSFSSKQDMRKKLFLLIGLVVLILVVLIIITVVTNTIKGRNLSYEQLEQEMKNAAMKFYEVQSSLLPQEEGGTSSVDADTLSSAEYGYMKPLQDLRKDVSCTGKVVVQKVSDHYVYTPYLNCGDQYETKELYQAVLETTIDDKGNGLYEINGEHVFRGEYVNNYVQLDQAVYRIVKVTSDNNFLLILNDISDVSLNVSWDDRYNADKKYDSGINNYRLSRMIDYLKTLYQTGLSNKVILSDSDREKLIPFSLCIGKRSDIETNNTNSIECSDVVENQMIGLLTVSDYINASLDQNCNGIKDQACKNYNYLVTKNASWWLLTASSLDSFQVYSISTSGYVDVSLASNYRRIRPVVMLNHSVMVSSGKGTINDPYILK